VPVRHRLEIEKREIESSAFIPQYCGMVAKSNQKLRVFIKKLFICS